MALTSARFLPLLVCVGFVAFEFAMAGFLLPPTPANDVKDDSGKGLPGDEVILNDNDVNGFLAPGNNVNDDSEKVEKGCSIGRYGTLTLFNQETAYIKLPCKYRLADFTCGDYRVKVTPGSAVDQEYSHRFSPNTVWVKVVNTKTDDYLKIRTSVKRLDKYAKGTVDMAWRIKEGSASVVDSALYDPSKAAAVLRKNGVFSVEFSSAERSVVVSCSDEEFVSKGLPETLCGDGTTTNAVNNAITTLFPGPGSMPVDAFVTYVVLNHGNVVQSPTCEDLASKFASCEDKREAALSCFTVFSYDAVCLAESDTSLRDYFAVCLAAVCDADTSAMDTMRNANKDYCE